MEIRYIRIVLPVSILIYV